MNNEERTTAIEMVENPMPMRMSPSIIRPVVNVDEALEAWKEYQALKDKLASDGDFVKIGNKAHPTKQYANKISKFFGLSVQIIKADKEVNEDGFTWHIWTRATAPNGQYREGDGHCASTERKFSHIEHDVYATAVTRSKNRAILELAGFGEVSAEEIVDDNGKPPAPAPAPKQPLSAKGKEVRDDLGAMLLEMANGDKDVARDLLEKYTAFTNDKREVVKASTLAGMSEKWIKTTYGKVKKDYEAIPGRVEMNDEREPGDDE